MHLPEMPNPFGFLGHWNDAKVALIFLLGLIDPNGPTGFYNPRQCAHGPDDNGNRGFDYALQDLLPSCSAI